VPTTYDSTNIFVSLTIYMSENARKKYKIKHLNDIDENVTHRDGREAVIADPFRRPRSILLNKQSKKKKKKKKNAHPVIIHISEQTSFDERENTLMMYVRIESRLVEIGASIARRNVIYAARILLRLSNDTKVNDAMVVVIVVIVQCCKNVKMFLRLHFRRHRCDFVVYKFSYNYDTRNTTKET
jgi:hypothetical protein